MSEKQTEALQIAQRLDWWINNTILTCERTAAEAAAELRRLDEVNKDLLEALKKCLEKGKRWHPCDTVVIQASAAITKAEAAK